MKRKTMLYRSIASDKDSKRSGTMKKTINLGIVGVRSGVGVTHTMIMLAMTLAKKKKVAVVEIKENGAFEEICKATNDIECINDQHFKYKKVEYFWGVDTSEFIMTQRDKFDYVIFDLGSFNEMIDFEEFIRMDTQIVIGNGVDWKIKEVVDFYNETCEIDIYRKWKYCIPFLDKKHTRDVKDLIENPISNIPFCMNPFKPNDDVKVIIKEFLI